MVPRFFMLIILVGLLALLGYWFYANPGFVILSWLGFQLRIPILLVLLVVVLLFFISTIIYKVVAWILRLPFRMSRGWTKRRKVKGEKELVQLASAVAAENAPDALKHLKRAQSVGDEEPLYWWYAAQAQGLADQHLEESKSYGKLMDYAPFLALKGQVQAALRRGDSQSALECLEKAQDVDGQSSWVLRNLLTLYESFKRYEEAEQIINKLEDLSYYTKSQVNRRLVALYEIMSEDSKLSDQAREEALRKAHYLDPSLVHVTEEYARLMVAKGHQSNAIKALEATWKESPSQVIADLYVELQTPENPMKAFELVRKLVQGTTSGFQSQLLTARYAIKAKLWGEARKILVKLEKKEPVPQVYKLLAELELKEHNNVKVAHQWAMKGYEI